MSKLKLNDLAMLREYAKDELLRLPGAAKLEGMTRSLTEGEKLSLAYYRACVHLLNSKKVLDKDWVDSETSGVCVEDSDPSVED